MVFSMEAILSTPVVSAQRHEICLSEVQPIDLVDLDGAEQERRVDAHNRRQGQKGPDRLRYLFTRHLVVRLQHVDGLSRYKIGQQKLRLTARVRRSTHGHVGRIAREMPVEDVRIDEGAQLRLA